MLDAVTVLARAPEPGAVKTRLARDVGDAAACALHEAMTLDVLALLAVRGWERVLALTGEPPAAGAFARACAAGGLRVERQAAGDLGDRMTHALSLRQAEGARRSAVVGTDCLGVLDALQDCDAALDRTGADVALAPARDGGFVAIASSRPLRRGCLAGPRWGSPEALEQARAALIARGVSVAVTRGRHDDVDDIAGLRRLAARLRDLPRSAPRVREALARLRLEP